MKLSPGVYFCNVCGFMGAQAYVIIIVSDSKYISHMEK